MKEKNGQDEQDGEMSTIQNRLILRSSILYILFILSDLFLLSFSAPQA
jgi:hypothetical protein